MKIAPRCGQEHFDLGWVHDLSERLRSHGTEHVAHGISAVEPNEAHLLILFIGGGFPLFISKSPVTIGRKREWGMVVRVSSPYLWPYTDRNFQNFAADIYEACFLKGSSEVLADSEVHTKLLDSYLGCVEEPS